ncbi:MAG: hypothetical protein K2K53_00320 [Oscillospiraceae bacterium]|nr:hypothetical protein [Oscillospiraceae bacterium]
MSYTVITAAIDDMAVDPLGVKEAVAMALEPLGRAHVLQVEAREPEQMRIEGVVHARPPAPRTSAGRDKLPDRQAPTASAPSRPGRSGDSDLVGCCTCACFCREPGWDEKRQGYWGRCGKTGRRVYKLWAQCGAWKAAT